MSERNTGLGNSRKKSPGEDKERAEAARSFLATIVCIVGIVISVGVALVTILLGQPLGVISAGVVGALLGLVGYAMGAGRLGVATIVVSVVALFFGVAASQGLIPGIGSYDRGLPSVEPRSSQNPGTG